jgi:hypothetical protein
MGQFGKIMLGDFKFNERIVQKKIASFGSEHEYQKTGFYTIPIQASIRPVWPFSWR